MPVVAPAHHRRLPHWPLLLLPPLVVVAAWGLASRQPTPWTDGATPWFGFTLSLAPAARLVDWVNAAVPGLPEAGAASLALLVLLGLSTLVTVLGAGVPGPLALGVALGMLGTRSVWSAVLPGTDVLPILVVSAAVAGLFVPSLRTLALASASLGVPIAAPPAAWAVAAAVLPRAGRRVRMLVATLLLLVGFAASLVLLRGAWATVPCLPAGDWPTRLRDVLQPGQSAAVSAWLAVQQTLAVLIGDVHLFGVLAAVWGFWRATPLAPARPTTVAAVAMTIAAVGAGVLPPALAAALLLPWWAPWFGAGLADLCAQTTGRRRRAAVVGLAAYAAVLPVLRHVTVVPEAFAASLPATTATVAAAYAPDTLVTSASPARLRVLRSAGIRTVPVDVAAIAACVAAKHGVDALDDSIGRLEQAGFRVTDVPVRAPLAAVLRDVRPGQLVALAMTSAALPYAGPQGLASLRRLGLRGAMPATAQFGAIAQTDAPEARGQVARSGLELRLEPADKVGDWPLDAPLVVNAQPAAATIDAPPRRWVESRVAAVAVLDGQQALTLRAAATLAPGLPTSLASLPAWRRATVAGTTSCRLAERGWTTVVPTARRISVPAIAAGPSRPVLAYLVSHGPPRLGVDGLSVTPTRPQWLAETFDRTVSADQLRLQHQATRDRLPLPSLPRGRYVARIELRPTGVWRAPRVALSAGVEPIAWLVAVAVAGRTAETGAVCTMVAGGDRLLGGQFGVVDDDTEREVSVWVGDGWHRAEHVQRSTYQWTATVAATAGFRLEQPRALVLAMDAIAASTAAGPQGVSVDINGTTLGTVWRGPQRAVVPAHLLRVGENTLTLRVPQVVQPPRDPRTLGALVRELRLIREPAS